MDFSKIVVNSEEFKDNEKNLMKFIKIQGELKKKVICKHFNNMKTSFNSVSLKYVQKNGRKFKRI